LSAVGTSQAAVPRLSEKAQVKANEDMAQSLLAVCFCAAASLMAWDQLAGSTVEHFNSFGLALAFGIQLRRGRHSGRPVAIWCWCLTLAGFLVALAFAGIDLLAG
jgi:hypothetical protein